MAKFFVEIMEVHTQVIEVEASNEMDARIVAVEVVSSGIQQDGTALRDETAYSHCVDTDEWRVFQ